jgi:hypothetical protein
VKVDIDESIGLVIQTGDETAMINSVEEALSSSDQEETVINNADDEITDIDPNIVILEETAQINSAEETPFVFGTDDVIEESIEINSVSEIE